MSVEHLHERRLRCWLLSRQPLSYLASQHGDMRCLTHLTFLSEDVRERVPFHVPLLFRRLPGQHSQVFIGFWIAVVWQLMIDRPNPTFVQLLGDIHREYLSHVSDPASILTSLGWELFCSITVAHSLISLRCDSTRGRRYVWWVIRCINVLSEPHRKALVRKGEADFHEVVSLCSLVRLQTSALYGWTSRGQPQHSFIYQLGFKARYVGQTCQYRGLGGNTGFICRLREHARGWSQALAGARGPQASRYQILLGKDGRRNFSALAVDFVPTDDVYARESAFHQCTSS